MASAGADWCCGFCGGNNPNRRAAMRGLRRCARKQATAMGKVGLPGAEVAAPFPEPRPTPPIAPRRR
jgi:hypothetical protein